MTVKELRNKLFEIEDQDQEVLYFDKATGKYKGITQVKTQDIEGKAGIKDITALSYGSIPF